MKKYLIFFAVSVLAYFAHVVAVKHGIYGDGNGYYSLAHTLFFQPKLDFGPVYRHLSSFQGASYIFSRVFWNTSPLPTGILNCPWLIGTAFFWLPSFFVVFSLSLLFRFSMFSLVYEVGCGITGIAAVLAGLYFIELGLRREFKDAVVTKVVIAIMFGSQLFYYAAFEPALAHQISFMLVSLILYLVGVKKSALAVFLLGFFSGLLAVTRMGEIVLAVPVLVYSSLSRNFSIRRQWTMPLLFIASFILGILPQLLLQQVMYGTPLYNPYLHAEKGVFHPLLLSSLYNHLFAAGGGFLLWSPLFLFAVWGFFQRDGANKRANKILYVATLGLYYLLICSWEYFPPAGFGNRFFLSAIPFLSFGLAAFIKHKSKYSKYILIAAVVWNGLLLFQFFGDSNRMVKRHGLTFVNLVTGQLGVPFKKALSIRF